MILLLGYDSSLQLRVDAHARVSQNRVRRGR
jgi:hypothetical protein